MFKYISLSIMLLYFSVTNLGTNGKLTEPLAKRLMSVLRATRLPLILTCPATFLSPRSHDPVIASDVTSHLCPVQPMVILMVLARDHPLQPLSNKLVSGASSSAFVCFRLSFCPPPEPLPQECCEYADYKAEHCCRCHNHYLLGQFRDEGHSWLLHDFQMPRQSKLLL
jgi:hypothetical protein